jgi:3,4-dihydroxy 2-butanone 4-phosphate synthase/GTP cyclohydrolase II
LKTSRIEDALAAVAAGQLVVVVDDEDRENEGDLIAAADKVTEQTIAFMVRHTSGVLCVALPADRLEKLALPQMVSQNSDAMKTAYAVTTDYRHGTTTGISAADRALTVRALVDPLSTAADFNRPGHVFPLRAVDGGVLRRAGHTEAAVDLSRLAGCLPGGVLAEVVNDDGSMARRPQLELFAAEHGLLLITLRDLIAFRRKTEKIVNRKTGARLPTHFGVFNIHGYEELYTGQEHVALVMGDVTTAEPVLVRVHSECMTGEIFGSMRCDCRPQLEDALAKIAAEGRGVLVYLRGHEGRGIGLMHKLRAYALQDAGRDTIEANQDLGLPVDSRDYSVGAQILRSLGVCRMRLMTNNPVKYQGIADFGLEITERVPLLSAPQGENVRYLNTKQALMGHLLGLGEAPTEGT